MSAFRKLAKPIDHVVFDILLFVAFCLLAILCIGYPEVARELPLPVSIIGIVMTGLLVLTDLSPYLYRKLSFVNAAGLTVNTGSSLKQHVPDEGQEHPLQSWIRIVRTVVWLVFFILALKYVGYIYTTAVFVFLVSWLEGHLRFRAAAISAIGTTLFFYVLFGLFLNVTF